jgi:hypothetical protein
MEYKDSRLWVMGSTGGTAPGGKELQNHGGRCVPFGLPLTVLRHTLAKRNGVLRSTDGGLTWEQMNTGWGPPPFRVYTLLIHLADDNRQWLYAGTSQGVWRYLLPTQLATPARTAVTYVPHILSPTPVLTPTFARITPPATPCLSPTSSLTLTIVPKPTHTVTPTPPKPTPAATTPPPPPSWNLLTPIPTAPPGYNPVIECVVIPCLPAPQLVEPQHGAEFVIGSTVEFRWTWVHCLPPGWKFAIRLSSDSPPHSYQYIDAPESISCQEGRSVVRYFIKIDPSTVDRFTTIPGTYYWNVAVTRSVGEGWERLSESSETRVFVIVKSPDGDDGGAPAPCPPNC